MRGTSRVMEYLRAVPARQTDCVSGNYFHSAWLLAFNQYHNYGHRYSTYSTHTDINVHSATENPQQPKRLSLSGTQDLKHHGCYKEEQEKEKKKKKKEVNNNDNKKQNKQVKTKTTENKTHDCSSVDLRASLKKDRKKKTSLCLNAWCPL